MAEDYKRLYKIVGKHTDKIVIAKVNADKERELGERFKIGGYPTLLWFPKGKDVKTPEKYHGGRDFNSMLKFVREHASDVKLDIHVDDRKYSIDADLPKLKELTETENKNAFVMFYAPWCGHCKAFKDHFESIAKAFVNEKKCAIVGLDGNQDRTASEKYIFLFFVFE